MKCLVLMYNTDLVKSAYYSVKMWLFEMNQFQSQQVREGPELIRQDEWIVQQLRS